MNTFTRSATAAFVALLSVVALSGCLPGTPIGEASEPPVTPTPSETPVTEVTEAAPVPTSVVVSASSITVLDETSTLIVSVPFSSDGTDAATLLTEALGVTPSVTTNGSGTCSRPGSTFVWGGL